MKGRLLRPGFTADDEADELQGVSKPRGLPGVASDDLREAFTGDASRAQVIRAAEAARVQYESDGNAVPWEVSDFSRVATMNAS